MNSDRPIPSVRHSRRGLLQLGWRSAAAVLALGGTRLSASTGNRVLVHLRLFGGNDSNNMIVPLQDPLYQRYASARGPLAIPSASLLPVNVPSMNATYGLHPALTELQDLYNRKLLAVVANTGVLHNPLTKPDINGNGIPADAADHLTTELVYIKDGLAAPGWAPAMLGFADRNDVAHRLFGFSTGISMLSATASVAGSRMDAPGLLSAMAEAPIRTVFPRTPLGNELKQVAQLIYAAPSVAARNPVIQCSASGYDTHSDELNRQAILYRDLSSSLAAFEQAMREIGAAGRVTLFTGSEFNRALVPNAQGGSEHGWGGHQLVLGHSVLGGDMYGTFPDMTVGGAGDAASNGTWIPTTSNDQYYASLATWMGVGLSQLRTSFPSLENFTTQDLRFVV